MAKEFYDWVKLVLDNWKTIVPILLFIASSVGWGVTKVEKDEELQNKDIQIMKIANHYNPPAPIVEGCEKCKEFVKRHVKELH